MRLNIKGDPAHAPVREPKRSCSKRGGLTQLLEALAEECAALPLLDDRPINDILYDASGLLCSRARIAREPTSSVACEASLRA